MSTALSGPASGLGQQMQAGILAAFEACNRTGGIGGRMLELTALDDGYEPGRTAPNMRTLCGREDMLGVIGNVGTPTAVAAIPVAMATRTPFFGAFTGAGVLRRIPPDRYVINYRASYAEETGAMVDALIGQAGLVTADIAFFTQRDAYGDSGYTGGIAALKRHGLVDPHTIGHGRYERNSVAVENAMADILATTPHPKAIIMVGAYKPCAAFILLARKLGLTSLFLNVSFVGADPLRTALGEAGNGVLITQVVPHFADALPVVQAYREALVAHDAALQPSFGSLEGYVSATVLLTALRRISGEITRETIVDALEGLGEFDIGLGAPLRLSAEEHQASHTVWPTVIRDEVIVPISWEELVSIMAGGQEPAE
ncbi:MAG: ABC transporter substrate-binding protein [Candidatus Hydrogenedentes bacterium]|nr:ABC transporter substrate-binding protein [Candidatus Hydrogenedentota bacterium]